MGGHRNRNVVHNNAVTNKNHCIPSVPTHLPPGAATIHRSAAKKRTLSQRIADMFERMFSIRFKAAHASSSKQLKLSKKKSSKHYTVAASPLPSMSSDIGFHGNQVEPPDIFGKKLSTAYASMPASCSKSQGHKSSLPLVHQHQSDSSFLRERSITADFNVQISQRFSKSDGHLETSNKTQRSLTASYEYDARFFARNCVSRDRSSIQIACAKCCNCHRSFRVCLSYDDVFCGLDCKTAWALR